MRRVPRRVRSNHTQQVTCTISAAALMLGVSQAATVGFNFQTTYCAAASYSGAVVTAPAFGIDTNAWESLTPIETGYSCGGNPAFQTLTEVIDTHSTGNGLNPLPNGSLSLTWSGYTGNVSGFGGYDRSPPNYTFGGNGYNPGNEQVYWGFIRDGVNFGPGSSGGDNNQPGYSIDITGLKSVFPNTPFVVQLIASSDSMQTLTNAFVIDATASSTQSVVYPSTPPVSDAGSAAWVRGIGGGLSTMTTNALNTDHLQIIGNRAQHGGDKTTGFDNASTIAGFIITDKPVLSMPPNQVVVAPGDSVTWSSYAVGVPPLSYQWRHNGQPIAGATSNSYTIATVGSSDQGYFDLLVTNLYGSAISPPVSVDKISPATITNLVVDSNPNGPERDGLSLGATWVAASGTRAGVMSFNGTNHSQIVVPGQAAFNAAAGTISFWMRSAGPLDPGGHPAMLFDRRTGNGCVIAQTTGGGIQVQTSGGANDLTSNSSSLSDGNWHNVTVVFSQANGSVITLYIDGAQDAVGVNSADWSWPVGQQIELGLSHDSYWQAYDGSLDDVRFYNRALNDAEVALVSIGQVVDNNALLMRLNFDAAPTAGLSLTWRCPDAILQSAPAVSGQYTDISGVASPYLVSPKGGARFYRYRGHAPVIVVSNPYLM